MFTLTSNRLPVNGVDQLRENRGDEAGIFGRHLRELRLTRGLTQAQVAERCGTMVPVISNLERGITVPTLSTLLHLAAALGCQMTELVQVFNEPTQSRSKRRP